jgi:hypothetical protein
MESAGESLYQPRHSLCRFDCGRMGILMGIWIWSRSSCLYPHLALGTLWIGILPTKKAGTELRKQCPDGTWDDKTTFSRFLSVYRGLVVLIHRLPSTSMEELKHGTLIICHWTLCCESFPAVAPRTSG